ncbi:MAG: site-2 protease family protein [Candidatus Nanohaloarchaea archaeon]
MLEGINPRLIFSIVFLIGLAALLWKDRNKIERHSILVIRRTQNGIQLLDKIAKKAPRFWNIYGWTGVIFALISIPLMVLQIGWMLKALLSGSSNGGASAILPSLSGEATFQSGASFIPVEYWLISIAIIMVVHEASHGIIARMEDFEINSVGWLVLGIIPGAFVEPKGEQMLPDGSSDSEGQEGLWDQGNYKQRLNVLSAGSFANYVTAAVFGLAYIGLIAFFLPNFYSGPVNYGAVVDGPAAQAGMTTGTLNSVNGQQIEDFNELRTVLNGTSPGENVTLETSEGEFRFELGEREGLETGFIGISRTYSAGWEWFKGLLFMVAFLNFAIGMFNMLPAKPLDGGQIVDTFVEEFVGDEERKYVNHFSLVMWVIVLGSIIAGLIL